MVFIMFLLLIGSRPDLVIRWGRMEGRKEGPKMNLQLTLNLLLVQQLPNILFLLTKETGARFIIRGGHALVKSSISGLPCETR